MTHWTEELFKDNAELFARFFERRFDQASEDARALLQLLADEQGVDPGRILDVACGTGRHVLAFAAEGYSVEGLDFSETFVDRARDRAAEQGVADRVDFHVRDMRDLDDWTGSFDLVTNFWNSLGYYDKATDVQVLSAMRQLLSREGAVAIEMTNKEHHVKNFESSGVREVEGNLHVERTEFDVETGRFPTVVDVFSTTDSGYEYLETIEWEQRLYAPVELREMCERAGFETVSLFGGFDGEPLSLDSPTVVVVATRD